MHSQTSLKLNMKPYLIFIMIFISTCAALKPKMIPCNKNAKTECKEMCKFATGKNVAKCQEVQYRSTRKCKCKSKAKKQYEKVEKDEKCNSWIDQACSIFCVFTSTKKSKNTKSICDGKGKKDEFRKQVALIYGQMLKSTCSQNKVKVGCTCKAPYIDNDQ